MNKRIAAGTLLPKYQGQVLVIHIYGQRDKPLLLYCTDPDITTDGHHFTGSITPLSDLDESIGNPSVVKSSPCIASHTCGVSA